MSTVKNSGDTASVIDAIRTIAKTSELQDKVDAIQTDVLKDKAAVLPERNKAQQATVAPTAASEIGGDASTAVGDEIVSTTADKSTNISKVVTKSTSADTTAAYFNHPKGAAATQQIGGAAGASTPIVGGTAIQGGGGTAGRAGGGGKGATAANKAAVQATRNAATAAGYSSQDVDRAARTEAINRDMLANNVEEVSDAAVNAYGNTTQTETTDSNAANEHAVWGLIGKTDLTEDAMTVVIDTIGRELSGYPSDEDIEAPYARDPSDLNGPPRISIDDMTAEMDWASFAPANPDEWVLGVYYTVTEGGYYGTGAPPYSFATWGEAANKLVASFPVNVENSGSATLKPYSQGNCIDEGGPSSYEVRMYGHWGRKNKDASLVVGCPLDPGALLIDSITAGPEASITAHSGVPGSAPYLPLTQPTVTPFLDPSIMPTSAWPETNSFALIYKDGEFTYNSDDPYVPLEYKNTSQIALYGADNIKYTLGVAEGGGFYLTSAAGADTATAIVFRANGTVKNIVEKRQLKYFTPATGFPSFFS